MHKYLALIRHEVKHLKWLFIYFALVFIGSVWVVHNQMDYYYNQFLREGTKGWGRFTNHFTNSLTYIYPMWLLLMILGMAVMVYVQFRESKNIGVGHFLKSLPIQDKRVYLIKVTCGILTYTIPFLVALVALLMIRSDYLLWMRDAISINGAGGILEIVEGSKYLFYIFVLYYGVLTLTYLLWVMMQYLITQPVASLVIGAISGFIPLFLYTFINEVYIGYLDVFRNSESLRMNRIRDIEAYLLPWLSGLPFEGDSIYTGQNFLNDGAMSFNYIGGIEIKSVIILSLCVILFIVAYQLSHLLRVEHTDQLIPFKGVRIAFIIGVSICSGALVAMGDIYLGMGERQPSIVRIHLLILVGALVGYVVSRKIACIGIKKR